MRVFLDKKTCFLVANKCLNFIEHNQGTSKNKKGFDLGGKYEKNQLQRVYPN